MKKRSVLPVYSSPISISFLFPLNFVKALQRKAQKFNVEKMDSNKKRRKVDARLRTTEGTIARLQQQLADAQDVAEVWPEERIIPVRYSGRNRGMTPEFEAHVRCLMATGGSARQVRDNLVLNAGHFWVTVLVSSTRRTFLQSAGFVFRGRQSLGVRPRTPSQTPSFTPTFQSLISFCILPL